MEIKVAVVTPTIASKHLDQCLQSVNNQTYKNLTHYIFIDGSQYEEQTKQILVRSPKVWQKTIKLEENVGKGWYGHRVYAACSFLVNADVIVYLDEDNWFEPCHIQKLVDKINEGNDWAYSFRKVFDKDGEFLLLDNCEALGEANSAWNIENHHFVDWCMWGMRTECLKAISGVLSNKGYGIDRTFYATAKQIFPKFVGTNLHTFCFRLGGNEYSVQKEFFEIGNQEILKRFNNKLPWITT